MSIENQHTRKKKMEEMPKKIADEQNSKHHFLDAVSSLLLSCFSFHSFLSRLSLISLPVSSFISVVSLSFQIFFLRSYRLVVPVLIHIFIALVLFFIEHHSNSIFLSYLFLFNLFLFSVDPFSISYCLFPCSSSLLLFHSSGYNNLQGFCL